MSAAMEARIKELEAVILDAQDALSSFYIYAPALAAMGHLEPVHQVGVQTLCVGAIREAAGVWENCNNVMKGVPE